ncbi:MAG: WecB/TagA/CpsF family glycosyltransferase [Terracidiphilus sp.]|jgi:N-acetylglucosaminyldiphosphoundecaprenol N-acetyl-beta-D-mannosaminyltransferase
MTFETRPKTAMVLGIPVEPLDMESAVARVAEQLELRRKGYVCMVCVHGIMEAQRDPGFAQVYAGAALLVPDGAPTVWVGRWQGFSTMQRVAGPDLMLEIFRRKEFSHRTHFLYGGKEGVAEELREGLTQRFPWAQIIGTYTPPFRDLTIQEEESLAARIRELKPDMMWVGIGTPKQDRFMMRFLPLLDSTLMFGVGAAFDFHTGRIKDSPQWVKRAGLQWLHRLIQEPRRLFWRYLLDNPAFVWRITKQLAGLRTYPQMKVDPGFSGRPQTVTDR